MSDTQTLISELSELTLPMMWQMRQDAVRAFEPLGIRPIKGLLVGLIAGGLQHPKDIAEVLETLPPTVSAMLGELEQKGYVKRTLDPDDRRRVMLELTPAGQAIHLEMNQRWHEISLERMAHLSDEELSFLVKTFRKVMAVSP